MKELLYSLKTSMKIGLRASADNPRNSPGLVKCDGLYPFTDTLKVPERETVLDLSSLGCSFPYPQVFNLSNLTIVCTPAAVYEYTPSGGLVSKLTGLTEGCLWTIADFFIFLVLTNGKQVVHRSAQSGVYSIVSDGSIPQGSCIADLDNSQAIIGAKDCIIPQPNIDEVSYSFDASSALNATAAVTP